MTRFFQRRMRPLAPSLFAGALLSGLPAATFAATPQPAPCPPAPSWAQPATLASGGNDAGAPHLVPGTAVRLTLQPMPAVSFAAPPGRTGHGGGTAGGSMAGGMRGADSHATAGVPMGGLADFTVTAPGLYRVMIDARAWIDVVEDGRKLMSVAHAPGPGCSSVVKMVDFRLAAGRQVLEISASPSSAVETLVTKLP